ncbi:MAG TPA: glycosyltransferase family 4 protein [Fibrobacteria bacterium]|nr:glycosyltransferase family 4 protein [Fibrobacteria bacterium]
MAMPRIRILHIVHSLGYGGMESRIARLARGLPRETHEVEVLSFKAASTGKLELAAGVPHRLFPIPSGLHPLLLLRLALAVRRGGYDIVHTHNWSSMFYGVAAAALARGPVVVHGEHGLNRSDLSGIPWKRLAAQRVLARIADWIVPVNGVIAAHVRKAWRLDDSRMTVIPNGVDLERFAPAPPGPAPEGFALGMVGRLDDVKDIGCALRAVRLLIDQGKGEGLRLILVGEGPMRERLGALAAETGVADRVEFAGARSDVEAWYPRFHLYLNTSVYEGMCNTLLEAMACGLPLVASRVPGNAAWLKETENGLFFEAGDARGLAGCIEALRADPHARGAMGRRNRLRAETEFDNRRFIEAYAGLYARLLANRDRARGGGKPG